VFEDFGFEIFSIILEVFEEILRGDSFCGLDDEGDISLIEEGFLHGGS